MKNTIRVVNLGIIYIMHDSSDHYGWMRLFQSSWGVKWKPKHAYVLQGERNGNGERSWIWGKYRFTVLRPV